MTTTRIPFTYLNLKSRTSAINMYANTADSIKPMKSGRRFSPLLPTGLPASFDVPPLAGDPAFTQSASVSVPVSSVASSPSPIDSVLTLSPPVLASDVAFITSSSPASNVAFTSPSLASNVAFTSSSLASNVAFTSSSLASNVAFTSSSLASNVAFTSSSFLPARHSPAFTPSLLARSLDFATSTLVSVSANRTSPLLADNLTFTSAATTFNSSSIASGPSFISSSPVPSGLAFNPTLPASASNSAFITSSSANVPLFAPSLPAACHPVALPDIGELDPPVSLTNSALSSDLVDLPSCILSTGTGCAQGPSTCVCAQGPRALGCAQGPSTLGFAQGPSTLGCAQGPSTPGCAHGPSAPGSAQGPSTLGCAQGPSTLGSAQGPSTLGCAQGPSTLGCAQGPSTLGCAQGPSTLGCAQGPSALGCAQGPDTFGSLEGPTLSSIPSAQGRPGIPRVPSPTRAALGSPSQAFAFKDLDCLENLPEVVESLSQAQRQQAAEIERQHHTLEEEKERLKNEEDQLHKIQEELRRCTRCICLAEEDSAGLSQHCKELKLELDSVSMENLEGVRKIQEMRLTMADDARLYAEYRLKMSSHRQLVIDLESSLPTHMELAKQKELVQTLQAEKTGMENEFPVTVDGSATQLELEIKSLMARKEVLLNSISDKMTAVANEDSRHACFKQDADVLRKRNQAQLTRLRRQLKEAQLRNKQWQDEACLLENQIQRLRQCTEE